ncbi:thioredoxin family protein [Pelagibaculum spongiae]|uniref:Thioredoxin family protein n=1 Tax=Pelagibaculum spongiae TaxID=2080658 RepID=A0A2V1GRR4_9GAMM|nr:thioredoxin family protein [Pelagibaculum spongiae]PVZ63457.1 thioredoxin family protein [Pelagibaculum spongiae]
MLLDTPLCEFGWKAPDFTLQDPAGNSYTLSEQLGDKGLLVMFICNHCPYVQQIAAQLAKDTSLLMDEGVKVLAVMSNDYQMFEEDSPVNMKRFARKYGFAFPYLVDENQQVGQQYDAVCTPDFFGFNAQGALQYRGRFDNQGMSGSDTRVPELLNAMRQIAETGQGPKQQSPSMGCSIKWR